MKYILIIIVSLYVLTFPKFAQTGETGEFFHREVNGKKGWNEEGDEDKDDLLLLLSEFGNICE